mmetsp:Transcript_31012/g.29620  ORF Transcript_31012/g.29620 Transcript_31012/m.29620 type:complete len:222 (+) Transcript_31012:221-886(+)
MFKGAAAKGATKKAAKGVINLSLDDDAIDTLFTSFADEDDPDCMSLDGIGTFCEQLGMDPSSDVRLLVLLWKLVAVSKPGQVTRKEFTTGMTNVFKKDSLEGLKTVLPSLDPGFLERAPFRDFYKFVFQFNREGTHKTIEKDVIAAMIPMVLDTNRAPHVTYFLEFLQTCTHQRITLDQWDSFLQFQYTVNLDLKNYDEDGAWPLLLDEYVVWRNKGNEKK